MVAVYPVLSLLIIFALSLLIVRVGSVALRMTGLSPDVASFQAASAFSGAGYTTEEAEQVVARPERRRIVKALIRLGSVGLASVIATLVLSFTDPGSNNLHSLASIVVGVSLIVLVARSRWLNRLITPLIERSLSRATDLEIKDYTQVLGLEREYRVAEIDVEAGDWLANERLRELDLFAEGVLVLGIRRRGEYAGAPGPETEIHPGDTVVLYGKEDLLRELSERVTGDDQAHRDAVEAHERRLEEQARRTGARAENRPTGAGGKSLSSSND